MSTSTTVIRFALGISLMLASCGAPDTEDTTRGRPTAPVTTDTDGDGWLDSIEKQVGTDHAAPSQVCNSSRFERTEETIDAVDFIIMIDNSGSMSGEAPVVFKSVFEELIPKIEQAPLDANIILMTDAKQLRWACQGCDASNITLIDVTINSVDALDRFIEHAAQIKPALTPTRLKVFALFSDDNAKMNAQDFDEALASHYPNMFHKAGSFEDNYVFHSITGIDVEGPLDAGVLASKPIYEASCATAPNAGEVYQRLSKNTGGRRFSICDKRFRYDEIFATIIGTVVDVGRIPCTIEVPRPTNPGQKANPYRVGLQVTTPETTFALEQIAPSEPCHDHAFFSVHQMDESYIRLCPELCQSLNETNNSTLQIATACLKDETCVKTSTQMTCN